nr:MAG TPA: hypothetical protein [Caudoviricetes sp.]
MVGFFFLCLISFKKFKISLDNSNNIVYTLSIR